MKSCDAIWVEVSTSLHRRHVLFISSHLSSIPVLHPIPLSPSPPLASMNATRRRDPVAIVILVYFRSFPHLTTLTGNVFHFPNSYRFPISFN